MAQKVMRMSRNGGMSLCASPEDKVGRGRCHHILNSNDVKLNYNKSDKCYYGEIKDNSLKGDNIQIKANENDIRKFVKNLSSEIDEEKKSKILKILKRK